MTMVYEDVDLDTQYAEGVNTVSEIETANRWTDPRNAALGYWRVPDDRMPRGRITLLQYGHNSMERIDRGHQRLPRYGTYKSDGGAGAWKPWQDPFLGIVQRDGLREFDAQQLIELGWYRAPGRLAKSSHRELWKKVTAAMDLGLTQEDAVIHVMPQLAGHDLGEYRCEICPDRVFSSTQLLRRHEALSHPEDVRSREIRDSVAGAIRESGGNQQSVVEAIEALVRQMAMQQAQAMVASGEPVVASAPELVGMEYMEADTETAAPPKRRTAPKRKAKSKRTSRS